MQIPLAYQNQTTGLVGNWQSNLTQDLLPPNVSSTNFNPANASVIYNTSVNAYKLTLASNSLFCYTWELFDTFFKQTISPDFSPTPPTKINDTSAITNACGTSAQCVYDAYYTGSLSAAASTRAFIERATADQSTLNVSYANSYCPYPDVPYAVMSISSLQSGGMMTITGCQTGFTDNLGGTTSCNCNAPNWSCDLAAQRCRCIGTPSPIITHHSS